MTRFVLKLLLLLVAMMAFAPGKSRAHSLGIDRAELDELGSGEYRLLSKVPPNLQPSILPPELPERCTMTGNPTGERGGYSVSFKFACDPELSAEDTLRLPWKREGTLLTAQWQGEAAVTRLASRDGKFIDVPLEEWLAGSGSAWRAAKRYTYLGVEHILGGIDHLLFVLALMFVVQGGWRLVKTITAFTLAHSITLALATFGYISLPSAPVEASIALSIAILAAEILRHRRGAPSLTFQWPWGVAFSFGLLHGLGFAGALAEIGLPPSEIPIALLFFNIGVEVGQLMFVCAILIVGWLVARVPMMSRVTVHLQTGVVYGLGFVATYWFLERTLAIL